jgi:hypothetical protein
MARITVNRPDPENRTFRHPDPFGWTLDHRGEIIEALYTILLGSPRLTQDRKDEKTRFKQWWRLVGSAVEHAAELAGARVDFSDLFLDVESNDEEAASLAEILQCLDRLRGIDARSGFPANFRSADVLRWATGDSEFRPARCPSIKRDYGAPNFHIGKLQAHSPRAVPQASALRWPRTAHRQSRLL